MAKLQPLIEFPLFHLNFPLLTYIYDVVILSHIYCVTRTIHKKEYSFNYYFGRKIENEDF